MFIIRIVFLLILCAVFSAQANAQFDQFASLSVEYGDLSEIVGRSRVFVQSENLESRGKILKELAKSQYPRFEVVGRIADADFLIIFGTNLVRNNTSSFTESTGDTNVVYRDIVVLKLISSPGMAHTLNGPGTRILWYTRKRQMFVRTSQFLPPFQSTAGGSKWSFFTSLFTRLLLSHPKLTWLPVSGSTEVSAVRDFIKAVRKANESPKLNNKVIFAPLRNPAPAPRPRKKFRRKL